MQSQVEQLLEQLEQFNDAYRAGSPVISDAEYDNLVAQLAELDPENEWLRKIEPEPVSGKKTIRLPEPMLSTQKAYDIETLRRWYANATSVCGDPGFVMATPKLDGFAAIAWEENGKLKMSTRGDGEKGQDISHFAGRTLCYYGKGEIVISKSYFEKHLSGKYENTRNVIAAAIRENDPEPEIAEALEKGAIVFATFDRLNYRTFWNIESLIADIENLWYWTENFPYQTDGLVLELTDSEDKAKLGSTSHHHRWQIAYKRNTEFHKVRVFGHEWQTSRNGRVTPVVLVEPTRIGGVTVSRVTGHHAANVIREGIGAGSEIEITRSGQVIPYISRVITKAPVKLPRQCTSCGGELEFIDDNHLGCANTLSCPAQKAGRLEHFFKTIGCDGFGPAVCELLKDDGVTDILDMTVSALKDRGISEGVAANLSDQIDVRVAEPIEDWRLLAALGLPGMGEVNCRKLMQHFTFPGIFTARGCEISAIEGFGGARSAAIINGLSKLYDAAMALTEFFQIETSKKDVKKSDLTVVFTGTMNYPRTTMEADARSKGFNVGSSVTSNTSYLVCGANVGANKTEAAKKKGVKVITESEYWTLAAGL